MIRFLYFWRHWNRGRHLRNGQRRQVRGADPNETILPWQQRSPFHCVHDREVDCGTRPLEVGAVVCVTGAVWMTGTAGVVGAEAPGSHDDSLCKRRSSHTTISSQSMIRFLYLWRHIHDICRPIYWNSIKWNTCTSVSLFRRTLCFHIAPSTFCQLWLL